MDLSKMRGPFLLDKGLFSKGKDLQRRFVSEERDASGIVVSLTEKPERQGS
jgi:hypothetical protein